MKRFKMKKLAAIDIGSNAVRLLIANTYIENNSPTYKKISLIRLPIRLGNDVFSKGRISQKKINSLIEAVKVFRSIMKIHKVSRYIAVATSAMRGAKNSKQILEEIYKETKIKVQVISGNLEATYILQLFQNNLKVINKNYLFIDVGGGSTEINILSNGKIITSESFKLGTVRLMNSSEKTALKNFTNWIKTKTKEISNITVIGTGGNANKILKILNIFPYKIIKLSSLLSLCKRVKKYTINERIIKLKLNPDRADVIEPALEIYINALEFSKSNKFMVPRIGLADALIMELNKDIKIGYDLN
jgi:exopolyphosphatase/guanosine-5'-triphosphate,3'-diphosphate pyrophosphatase